jgi:2-polyprenyl-6-methoxyphenol hydroxylase-like FAD-dependent oxidoreductase
MDMIATTLVMVQLLSGPQRSRGRGVSACRSCFRPGCRAEVIGASVTWPGSERLNARMQVHVVGAGPVGLLLTALLQPMEGFSVRLYEKRHEYTRTRMVQLAPYLVADSLESYRADAIDGDSVEAIFDPAELEQGLAFRQSIAPDLRVLLQNWVLGFCPLNSIERSLSDLIDARGLNAVERTAAVLTAEDAMALVEPGDVLIDAAGSRSLLRDHLVPGSREVIEGANTVKVRLEYALVITFLYGQPYDCNEHCKYYKNIENAHYKFIPMVHRTHYDGSVSHVTGIVNISAEEYEAMPSRFDGQWLRSNVPDVAESIDKIKEETHGEILGELEIVRIPLDLYRARNATNRQWLEAGPSDHPFADSSVFLAGDSAIGSPYFQSISLGFECAMFLAGLIAQRDVTPRELLDRYELHIYKQWLRVYTRSKMIKHNKDLFESLDNPLALLDKLHIY